MNTLTPNQVQTDHSAVLIDVREPDEYRLEHIPNSHNIPLSRIPLSAKELQYEKSIILTCQSGRRAQEALLALEAQGLHNLFVLQGGLNAWKQANQPTDKAGQWWQISVMRQVQLVVGTMILVAALVKPLWWLGLIAGAGLFMAGLTNTCLLATVLSRMPWNQRNHISQTPLTCSSQPEAAHPGCGQCS